MTTPAVTYRDRGDHPCRGCQLAIVPRGIPFCGRCRTATEAAYLDDAAAGSLALAYLLGDLEPPEPPEPESAP